ncbi:MAG: GNAT family N-acetyltransferase [Acidimicrobiia bacterium]
MTSTGGQPDVDWVLDDVGMDWDSLSELYRVAPLGEKPPDSLRTTFSNSMFKSFIYSDSRLIGAGRAIADGLDCAYIADVAVHPDFQGRGLGKAIISRLVGMAKGHRKIILYANPGTEGFYLSLGFLPMTTAMAVWDNQERAIEVGLLRNNTDPIADSS